MNERSDGLARVLKVLGQATSDLGERIASRSTVASAEQIARRLLKANKGFAKATGCTLIGDPARDILLELFANGDAGRSISTTDCAHISGAPATTALRYVTALEAMGHIERVDDPSDGRRRTVKLTAHTRAEIRAYLEALDAF